MNKFTGMGRATRDVEIRYTQGSEPVTIARFSLAIDRKFKRDNQPDADFINVIAFGRQAEFAEKYIKKGNKIIVCGHVQTGNYTNKDGIKVYTTDIIADEFYFAESKGSEKPVEKAEWFVEIDDIDSKNDLPF